MWLGEMDFMHQESARCADGSPPRDGSIYHRWRSEADEWNVSLLGFYSIYFSGYCSAGLKSLALTDVLAAFEVDGVPKRDYPDLIQRVSYLHGLIMKELAARGEHD